MEWTLGSCRLMLTATTMTCWAVWWRSGCRETGQCITFMTAGTAWCCRRTGSNGSRDVGTISFTTGRTVRWKKGRSCCRARAVRSCSPRRGIRWVMCLQEHERLTVIRCMTVTGATARWYPMPLTTAAVTAAITTLWQQAG